MSYWVSLCWSGHALKKPITCLLTFRPMLRFQVFSMFCFVFSCLYLPEIQSVNEFAAFIICAGIGIMMPWCEVKKKRNGGLCELIKSTLHLSRFQCFNYGKIRPQVLTALSHLIVRKSRSENNIGGNTNIITVDKELTCPIISRSFVASHIVEPARMAECHSRTK